MVWLILGHLGALLVDLVAGGRRAQGEKDLEMGQGKPLLERQQGCLRQPHQPDLFDKRDYPACPYRALCTRSKDGPRTIALRAARYAGLAKTKLQHVASAAAINVQRLDDWWTGTPRAQTRRSALAKLAA